MTTSTATFKGRLRPAGGCLGLAASPTFAAMAWIVTAHASPIGVCGAGAGGLPVDGMGAMYLLMSLFHLSPWLRLAAGRAGMDR